MTSHKAALGVGLGCTLVGIVRPAALGQETTPSDSAPAMTAIGDCPSKDAIWADVKSMVPSSDLGKIIGATVEVADLGTTYRVRILGDERERQRTFHDGQRDCDHRARFAAIFVVVTLLPPDVLLESPPEEPPAPALGAPAPPAVVVVASPPSAPRTGHFRMEASGLFDSAPSIRGSGQSTTLGGEVRTYWGANRWAAVVGLGIEPRASFTFGATGVHELRVPFDAGVALVSARRRLAVAGELGLAAAILRISGADTPGAQSGTRLELGGRMAIAIRIGSPTSGVAPVLGIHALIFPNPNVPTLRPTGDLGRLPALWLGATAGVSFAP